MKKILLLLSTLLFVISVNAQTFKQLFANIHSLKDANKQLKQMRENFNPIFTRPFYKNTGYSLEEIHYYNGSGSNWNESGSAYLYNYNEIGLPLNASYYDIAASDTTYKYNLVPFSTYWDDWNDYIYNYPYQFFWSQKNLRGYKHVNNNYIFGIGYTQTKTEAYNYIQTSFIEYNIDASGNYTAGFKDTLQLDENNYYKQYNSYLYDATTGIWENNEKYEYTTDDNGNVTLRIEYLWNDPSSTWTNNHKFRYSYNNNNYQIASTKYNWDNTNNEWVPEYRDTSIFDPNTGYIQQYIYQTWSSTDNQFINSYRRIYTYNSEGKRTGIIYQNWDNTNYQWVNYIKDIYTYNSNGYPLSDTSKYWDNTNNIWVNYSLVTRTYDGDLITSYTYSYWDATNLIWVPNYRYIYSYNKYNQKILIHQNWDNTTSQWINYEKYVYDYTDGRLVSYQYFTWNTGTNQWNNEDKITYQWREVSTSVNDLEQYSPKIYPNPASEIIFLPYQKANVEVFNTSGQKIIAKDIINGSLNIKDLKNGLYIIKVNSAEGNFTSKFIKE